MPLRGQAHIERKMGTGSREKIELILCDVSYPTAIGGKANSWLLISSKRCRAFLFLEGELCDRREYDYRVRGC